MNDEAAADRRGVCSAFPFRQFVGINLRAALSRLSMVSAAFTLPWLLSGAQDVYGMMNVNHDVSAELKRTVHALMTHT